MCRDQCHTNRQAYTLATSAAEPTCRENQELNQKVDKEALGKQLCNTLYGCNICEGRRYCANAAGMCMTRR